jgi:chitinase
MKNNKIGLFIPIILIFGYKFISTKSEPKKSQVVNVIAYYSGNATLIDSFPIEKLTHIIYSFCHLKENRLSVDNKDDSAVIKKLVSLKNRKPSLKVLLSLGGWGGCQFCSPVFSSAVGRTEFASSVKELNNYFQTDGIDLDWEYPAISGYPGHAYTAEDKPNFTALVKALRDSLGNEKEISFAAGGFLKFIQQSVEWDKVMPLVNNVNLMSYDLVSGYSTVTGHHTPLYSTAHTTESADRAIRYLDSIGVPKNKIVIGSAFYARSWEEVENKNNGLYQNGKFKSFIGYNQFSKRLSTDSGFIFYYDNIAKASYAYNADQKIYATFDDSLSIIEKTKYVISNGLNGIMFWELTLDKRKNGYVDLIDRTIQKYK